MFLNLKAEMIRNGLTNRDIASVIRKTDVTVRNKMAGRTRYNEMEMHLIRDYFVRLTGKEFTIDYLFAKKEVA